MSKSLLTTTELEAVAVQFFEDYPNHQDVYVTEDGQSFLKKIEPLCMLMTRDLPIKDM